MSTSDSKSNANSLLDEASLHQTMCRKPRFPPKIILVRNVHNTSSMYQSADNGRIYTECKECKGEVCMNGPKAKL